MTLKLQPRRLTPCHRHPNQPLTSLCAPCLRERLSILNPSPPSGNTCSTSSSTSSAFPELRRSKTFSAENCESLGVSCEPRRRSCEVRAPSSLEDLLTVDDHAKCMVESKNLGLLGGTYPVPEVREEEDESDYEIRVSADVTVSNATRLRGSRLDLVDTVEDEDSRTMKEFIDLELQSNKPVKKDFKEIAGSFWIAASVFSKKLQKWKGKQKSSGRNRRNHGNDDGSGLGEMRLENLRGRRLRDAQLEPGDYGFGRRSSDTDPRFSIDLGRASIDGGRTSVDGTGNRFSLDLGRASVDCGRMLVEEAREGAFDAPRASWDGYMNARTAPRNTTPMVSVIENAMATVYGIDNRSLVTEPLKLENDDRKSYGAVVARHLDSVSLHMGRKSVDKCSTKTDLKENGEVEIFHGSTKLLITEKELMDSRMSSSLKDDSSDSFDTTSKDFTSSVSSSSTGIESRKSRKWGKLLTVLGLLSRQKQCKSAQDEEERFDRTDVECSKKEDEVSSDPNWKLTRSHSVASSKSLYTVAGSALGMKKTEIGVLGRNRSVRLPPNNVQNGMLRFYLAPLRSAKRNKFGKTR